MLDKRTLHMKVQEQCDCFATADPLAEMAGLKGDADTEEAALKWIALAVLHGINANAKEITLHRTSDGDIEVIAKYRKSELPAPGSTIGKKVFEAMKDITHIEGEKGSMPVVMGIRDSSVEVSVKLDQDSTDEELTIEFPKIRN